ncbi:hypothetical protein [Marinomonas posidonica]|uniref:hypothetical protein n=1 Tax=Marinomonas posidonica TaxID=936476 RepID=UPI003735E145
MGLWDDITDKATTAYEAAESAVTNWWESGESAPQSYEQTAAYEASASGAYATTVPNAQSNTGETVVVTSSPLSTQTLLIGGGVLAVVLLVVVLMMKGGR